MKDLSYITALVVAITGLIAAVGGIIALMRRTRKIDVKVNGHLTHLLDILDRADITLPSGAILRYEPPREPEMHHEDPETSSAMEYLAELREAVEDDTGSS